MGRVERYITMGFVLTDRPFCEFEVDYYEKLKEVIELQYHSEHISLFIQMLLV
jgi:hypothetical protein